MQHAVLVSPIPFEGLLGNERPIEQLRHVGGGVREALRAREDPDHGVVVPRRDRIELVIVAARAGYGQAEEALRDDVQLLVVDVVEHLGLVLLGEGLGPEREQARRHDPAAVRHGAVVRREKISRDLLLDETIVGEVLVEGRDHVVTVAPRVGVAVVLVVAGRVRVAGHVEPVSSPALAVARGGEEPLDHRLERRRRAVGEKAPDLVLGRRQTRQVIGHAPQERRLLRGRRGGESFLPELREDEPIDGRAWPRIVNLRRRGIAHRLERPVGTRLVLGARRWARVGDRRHGRGDARGRVRSARRDPHPECVELLRREPAVRRHLDPLFVADGIEEAVPTGVTRGQERSGRRALAKTRGAGQIETSLESDRVVTGKAARRQDGADVGLEELLEITLLTPRGRGEPDEEDRDQSAVHGRNDTFCPPPRSTRTS